LCTGHNIDTSGNALSGILKMGGPILYLVIQCIALFFLVVRADSGSIKRMLWPRKGVKVRDDSKAVLVDSEKGASNDLEVMQVSKRFHGSEAKAVDEVSFDVAKETVYALLGAVYAALSFPSH
jgi:hypothetical protein